MRIAAAIAVGACVVAINTSLCIGPAHADNNSQRPPKVKVTKKASSDFEGSATIILKKKASNPTRTHPGKQRQATGKRELSTEQFRAYRGLCNRMNQAFSCTPGPTTHKPSRAVMTLNLSGIARTLITRIRIPDPTPQFGPDPSVNQWKMAAVGYPLWLWTARPTTITDRVRAYGVTFTLRATWTSTRFDMGEGHHLTCTTTQPYTSSVKPGTASPVCGYTYATASLPKGQYTVTATTHWRITWTALGMSGTMPASFTRSRQLPVGELDALVVG